MKLRSAVIVLLFFSSVLSGCVGNDSEKDDRINTLETELSNSTANYDEALEQISTLQNALNEANTALAASDAVIDELYISISELEILRDDLLMQREDIISQLTESENNNSALEQEISVLDLSILDLNSQIEAINQELQRRQNQILQLQDTVMTLQNTMDALTYSTSFSTQNCPLDNPGSKMNIGYDNGEGLGIAGDGIITFDEIQYIVGECPGNFGRVYNETTEEHDWGPQRTVVMGGILYFLADDGIHDWELWRSDGTLSGTYIVKDIRGEDCIMATDPDTGEQYEDCTNWGSTLDISWDNIFNDVELVAGNNKLFFTASMHMYAENNGGFPTLWVSDGTEEGTNVVYDFWGDWDYNCNGCEFDTAGITELVVIPGEGGASDRVVFSTIQAIVGIGEEGYPKGEELWISDGTTTGTRMIANIEPETSSWVDGNGVTQCCADWDGSVPRDMVFKGNQVWFTAQTESYGREFYRFGLELGGGLFLIKDINSGVEGSNPMLITPGSGGIYLSANDGINGQELHYSQGDAFSTNIVKDIWPGLNNSSNPMWLTKLGSELIFSADNGENGRELWITDNTEEGTRMIKDINPGNNSSNPTGPMKEMGGFVYFSANDGTHGWELWRTDGTESGTTMVSDIHDGENGSLSWGSTAHWHGEYTMVHNGHFYFSANDGENGEELWRTNGTDSGTMMIVDANPGEGGSWPWWFSIAEDRLYFTAWDGNSRELWFYWDNPGPVIS